MKKTNLIDLLQTQLERLHHNATPTGKLILESDYEIDLFEEEFQFIKTMAFDDLNLEFSELKRKYGNFFQYGRGGRTVAPSKLIPNSEYAHAIKVKYLDLEPLEARWLYKELKRFNDYVIDWNQKTPDLLIKYIKEEYSEQIKANKNKKRITRTITSYE